MESLFNVFSDVQEISHALSAQDLASSKKYHAEYDEDIRGRAPSDLANSYPEHKQHKKASKLTSKVVSRPLI